MAPLWVAGLFGKDKSPRRNPILGVQAFNEWGLHRRRVEYAAKMASWRRSRLASKIDSQSLSHFEENGYFLVHDFLPPERFARLKDEIFGGHFNAWEMREGAAVTRYVGLPPDVLRGNPELAATIKDQATRDQVRYAASHGGEPVSFLQIVIVDPSQNIQDPQTNMHTDTFHATSKAWLFLQDVGEEDGPFFYVPGSHRLTAERLAWHHECSIVPDPTKDGNHSGGSFRAHANELDRLNLPQPKKMVVPANTLIVADTFGLHGRTPSDKPTTRVEVHWYMRRNPYLPWLGLDPLGLPGLCGRQMDISHGLTEYQARLFGNRAHIRNVGKVRVDAPPKIDDLP